MTSWVKRAINRFRTKPVCYRCTCDCSSCDRWDECSLAPPCDECEFEHECWAGVVEDMEASDRA